ncbi:MAG: hypothetical protein IKQ61_04975 [Spirochaetales bacterium]|nr:hypothetical protein [Spirochaetales bacterium]
MKTMISLCLLLISVGAAFSGEIDKYKMSLQLYNDGFIDVAGKSFAEFLTDYPTSMYRQRATYYLALTEIQTEDYQSAVKHLTAVAADPKFEFYNDVLHYLTLGCFSIGQFAESERYLTLTLQRNVVTEQSDLAEYEKLLYISIINNINLKKYQKALAKADDYFRHSHFTVYRYDIEKYLLNYYISGQDYENAAEMCRMIFEEPKLNVTDKILVEYNYILSMYEMRKYDEAISFFSNNIAYYNESLYLLISEAYGKLGDTQNMIKYLNDVYARSGDKDILVRIASLAVADGDYDKAIKSLEGYPNKDKSMMQMLGDMYYRKNDFTKAFDWFNKVGISSLNDENFQLYFNCIVRLGKTNIITTFYEYLDRLKNVSIDARNNILYKMAETFYNSGDYQKSEKVMAMWLSEFVGDEHYDKVLFMQAMTLKKNKRYDRAIVELSKLQKYDQNKKKDDDIYRESFAEKGELYFIIREYHSAIESYKKYVAFSPAPKRYAPVLLQLGNAYYNIKDYNNAYKTYSSYIDRVGPSEQLYTKVANSLLKPEKYDEIKSYFTDRKNIGDYAAYVLYYANYKTKSAEGTVINAQVVEQNRRSEYMLDMIYLSVLSRNENKNMDGIEEEYSLAKPFLTDYKKEQTEKVLAIKNEYLKAFISIGHGETAMTVYQETDPATLYFVGKSFYDGVYMDEAKRYFDLIMSKGYLSQYENAKLTLMTDFYTECGDYQAALDIAMTLIGRSISDIMLLTAFELAFRLGQTDKCGELSSQFKNALLHDYANVTAEYFADGNRAKYKKAVFGLVNQKKIDNILSRQILLKYIRMESEDSEFSQVLTCTSKIPEKEFPSLSPEFKYLEASACLGLRNEKKASAEFLKIFYLYPSKPYWVEKAVRQIVDIYRAAGDEDKAAKVIRMYDERFVPGKIK